MSVQPLNYTPKAIEALMRFPFPNAPWSRMGRDYLVAKLRSAVTFVLPDHGTLLDRSKPRPEVPELMFKPPFPVIALEYNSSGTPGTDPWTSEACSKRIALAWEFTDDLPKAAPWQGVFAAYGPGVVVASIPFYDAQQTWLPIFGAVHLPYDGAWSTDPKLRQSPFLDAMVAQGRIRQPAPGQAALVGSTVPILPEALMAMAAHHGRSQIVDTVRADCMDEVNAYFDTVIALACRNVTARQHPAPAALNKQRIRNGKPPLKPFHVLEIDGEIMPGAHGGDGSRNGPREHLRRGHVRRLPGDRVTWVNQTMVHGRGGRVDKAYAIGGAA